jgi:response regulator RpfG family c-di-GMP phosphodiesterase
MTAPMLPRVLCVDDEPNVLNGLARQLHRRFEIVTAIGGAAGLQTIKEQGPFAVVVSDLRMPGMDGIAFLRSVREAAPEAVRVLLTGQADLSAAIAAVNEGHIFRFLSKPCPPDELLKALETSAEQHRLITAERVLLRDTLMGSIQMLLDIMALLSPAAFGRAARTKQYVVELLSSLPLGDRDRWSVEIAAMLSQIGFVSLPPQTIEKLYHGKALIASEQAMLNRLPEVVGQLLNNIPRLEVVRDIMIHQDKRFDGSGPPDNAASGEEIPWGARVLKVVLDFDVLMTQGVSAAQAIVTMRKRAGWYDTEILEKFAKLQEMGWEMEETKLALGELRPGMVFSDDVKSKNGRLLIARGYEVTVSLLEKIRNLSPTIGVSQPLRVFTRKRIRTAEPVR